MRNENKVKVLAIGTSCLVLSIGHCFDLDNIVFLPSLRHNLLFLSKVDTDGYFFSFYHGSFNLFKNTLSNGYGFLSDGCYQFYLDNTFVKNIYV